MGSLEIERGTYAFEGHPSRIRFRPAEESALPAEDEVGTEAPGEAAVERLEPPVVDELAARRYSERRRSSVL